LRLLNRPRPMSSSAWKPSSGCRRPSAVEHHRERGPAMAQGGYLNGFPITVGSVGANYELVPAVNWYSSAPHNAYGPSLRGGPRGPQTIPTGVGASFDASGAASAGTSSASNQPWSFGSSGLPLLLIMLVIGLLGLRYIHWRGRAAGGAGRAA